MPDLESDGSQTMVLRCFKHHQSAPQTAKKKEKAKLSGSEDDIMRERDSDDEILGSSCHQVCPISLFLKTTYDGYWSVDNEQSSKLKGALHQPYIQAQPAQKKGQQKQPVDSNGQFEDILNQEVTKRQSGIELFSEDFKSTSFNLASLNQKLKKMGQNNHLMSKESLFMEDISTKPSISPASATTDASNYQAGDSPQRSSQLPSREINYDHLFSSSISVAEPIKIQPVPQKLMLPDSQESQKENDKSPIKVVDSRTFLKGAIENPLPQTNQEGNFVAQKINFKRNLAKKLESLKSLKIDSPKLIPLLEKSEKQVEALSQNGSNWYMNDEDRILKGIDFTTKNEDIFALMKYLGSTFTKGDFYRYQTDPARQNEIKTLIMCTESMKEKFLIYRDIMMLCPCMSAIGGGEGLEAQRFKNMMSLVIYGVNSHGRNVIFGVSLVAPNCQDSLEFVLKEFFYYMGKLPKALIIERNFFGIQSLQCILKVVKKVQHNHLANKSSTPQDSRVLYCPYSVQKDISTRFDFLKKSEQNLYSVLVSLLILQSIIFRVRFQKFMGIIKDLPVQFPYLRDISKDLSSYIIRDSLPFLDDFEQFEKSLREVQQIPWGSPNLENLKVYLKDLEKDKYLWAIAYRSILVKDYAINKKLISQGLHIGSIFTGDLSACQRNVSVDCAMSNNFLLNSMGDFSPKECFKALQRLEENDVSFTNESKIVAAATLPALEANDVYKHFIASSHTVYIQQRFKYQMQKGMHYIVLESNSDQLDQIPKPKQWIVRNKEGSLKFNVTTHQITQQILGASKETTTIIQCDCGFSSISGIPCSHEFCVQHYLWHNALKNFQTPPHVLKIKQRWLQAYEDYYKGKLHEPPGGLMYEHKQLNFNLKHAQNAQQTKSAGKVAVCKNQRKRTYRLQLSYIQAIHQQFYQKQVEGLTPTKTKVTNAQHNEEVFDVPEDDAFSEDCELLISNAQSESDLQIQLNQHSSNSSVQKQKPRSSNKISIKMPTFSLNEFSASHKLGQLKIMNKKEKKPKVDKIEKKLIGKRRSGKRKREEKDSENEYANSAEEREKDIKEGLKDVAYKKRVIAGTAPSKVEVIEAIQSETESKKNLRRSRRQAKHDNKIKIKIDQQKLSQTLSTQPSNPTSIGPSQAKVINPKHRFNPKQSQNSILSQCSGSSQIPSIMTGSSQFTYSFSQAGQRDDADSILNLDDILKESEDPEKPPSSLEKWAGPNIFRDIVIQKPKYHSGVKIGLGQSQDDNPSQRTLIFINTQNTQVQPCSQQA